MALELVITPLLLKNSPDFETLRAYLGRVGFDEPSVCTRLGVLSLGDLFSHQGKPPGVAPQADALGLITRFFVLGHSVERKLLEDTLTSPVVQALSNVGLTDADACDARRLICPLALYPVGGVLTASDRWVTPEGKPVEAGDDFVYPATTPNTISFLAGLPPAPCENFLELCSGAATVALAASRYARHVWAVDITVRSTQIAEFNRLLNGIENLTTLRGDCYEGLGDLQFDRIVAHPPYMPVARPAQVFYDGGQDGEQVTRRLVQGLPRYLRSGGCFYCQAQGSDRRNTLLQQRVRQWLGASQDDFDVAVIERRAHPPEHAALIYAMKTKGGYDALNLMRDTLSKLDITSLSYGWIIVQRKQEPRSAFTVRRAAGLRCGREELAWLLAWETFAAHPSRLQELLRMKPLARPSLELRTVHRLEQGELAPAQLTLHVEDPFAMDCQLDPWMVYLVPLCNGESSVRELWETCKAHKFIHPDTPPEEFARLIAMLVSGGFIAVPAFRPPDAASGAKTPDPAAATGLI